VSHPKIAHIGYICTLLLCFLYGKEETRGKERKRRQTIETIHGMFFKHLSFTSAWSERTGADTFLFKFIVKCQQSDEEGYTTVMMRGSAAKSFCDRMIQIHSTKEDIFSFTGKWVQYTNEKGEQATAFMATGYEVLHEVNPGGLPDNLRSIWRRIV
jgi:hypothetical protein